MDRPLTQHIRPDREPLTLREYEQVGGYQAARQALQAAPRDVTDQVLKASLRGRGGGGFLTGQKWSLVPPDDGSGQPKYIVANGDEMEPGTMKDRWLLEGQPHQLIEGLLLGAYAIQARVAYIFLRWDYKLAARRLQQALAEAYAERLLGAHILGTDYQLDMVLHTSAGRYMCGEETGLLNAIEGRRANPRNKPPFAVTCGLWGRPTAINNVETLCCIPHIVQRGGDWFRSLSRSPDEGGTKIYGVSGRVRHPGLWELPLGTTARELLEEHAGGLRDGYVFRGLLPGGASTDFLVAQHLDVKLDFSSVEKAGSRLGTGTMVVLDDRTCPVGLVLNLMQFFARESCGWCTPCREGLPWLARTLQALEDGQGTSADLDLLDAHVQTIRMGHTFCALAPGAMAPLGSALKYFRRDFERHVADQRCPWRAP
ncbi:MAG: NADH-quinone oxidoreductase subunit NuoF [Kiritimatiellaeota bacterium]|nr:NADH-quinone oxidoreductase subunit NuoF [Kiritimatiellota bacterium]